MPHPDELRADLIELLRAYIEGTQAAGVAWPAVERQPTPVAPEDEKQFLWEIVSFAYTLWEHVGEEPDGRAE